MNPKKSIPLRFRTLGLAVVCLAHLSCFFEGPLYGDDQLYRISFVDSEHQPHTIEGKILVAATDGGILVLGRDLRLWNVTPQQLRERKATNHKFQPFTEDELGVRLRTEFGEDFEIVKTRHYVICTNAGKRYARWCGALFERLMNAFQSHWKSRKLKIHEPQSPLIAIVFANRQQFAAFATEDAGPDAAQSKGYYSIPSNRMVIYDLTASPNSPQAKTTADIVRKVAASPFNVATVVHEATHQIAFNCGMHTRYADNPLWVTEGMAMYFETPDLRSRSGWRTIGKVNTLRLRQFRQALAKGRKSDTFVSLLNSDDRFRDPDRSAAAYAESWALTYFLIKTKRIKYVEYLGRIADKPQLLWDEPDQRLQDFKQTFGDDLRKLEREFLRYVQRLGRKR